MTKEELDKNFSMEDYTHMRELIFVHEHVSAAETDYYASHGNFACPPYILEKLNTAKRVLDHEIAYWENRERNN